MFGMGASRLDRLEEQAKGGFASPSQQLKLISEVRRRRREMDQLRSDLERCGDKTAALERENIRLNSALNNAFFGRDM